CRPFAPSRRPPCRHRPGHRQGLCRLDGRHDQRGEHRRAGNHVPRRVAGFLNGWFLIWDFFVEGHFPMTASAPVRPKSGKATAKNRKYYDDPEVVLMLRVKKDDPSAFAELLRRNWSYVFGRCYRRLHDREDAEDLAQEVFLRVYR